MPFYSLLAFHSRILRQKRLNPRRRGTLRPVIRVVSLGASPGGILVLGSQHYICALGKAGCAMRKQEGDGATPRGAFPLKAILYRSDRGPIPKTGLPTFRLKRHDGWCDDPSSQFYNRPVLATAGPSHENMWRPDGLYDVVGLIGHNDRPASKGRGSAVFFHVIAKSGKPTQGCIAVSAGNMRKILGQCPSGATFVI